MEFFRMDIIDARILKHLQKKADTPLSELALKVKISKTACWNRIRRLEESSTIVSRQTILNRAAIELPIVVFLSITVRRHSSEWVDRFTTLIDYYDEITEVYRLTGEGADYQLKIICTSIEAYDKLQQELISKIEFNTMATRVSLQEIKQNYSLPLDHILEADAV